MLSQCDTEGSNPFSPPTHRPLLRLCHYNPQAGFLSPRWAGDSMCEQNSPARAASRNYYLFLAWKLSLASQSAVMVYVHVWGEGRSAKKKKKLSMLDYILIFRFYLFLMQSAASGARRKKWFLFACLCSSWLIKSGHIFAHLGNIFAASVCRT